MILQMYEYKTPTCKSIIIANFRSLPFKICSESLNQTSKMIKYNCIVTMWFH